MTDKTVEFDFDAWLDGATVAESSVDVYQKLDLLGVYEDWERRYEAAKDVPAEERRMGEANPITALEAEGTKIIENLRASKTTWYLAALATEDEQEIIEAHPLPEVPATFAEPQPVLVSRPSEVQSEAFIKAYEAWGQRHTDYNVKHAAEFEAYQVQGSAVLSARGAEKIVRCLRRIERNGVIVSTSISLEQALSLSKRIGDMQVARIGAAIDAATKAEPVVPGPFSPVNSESDPT